MTETTALAIPTGSALTAAFAAPENIDPIIKRIRDEVKSHAPDLTTDKGRKEIADALRAMSGRATPEAIAMALIEGKIPHVKVNM